MKKIELIRELNKYPVFGIKTLKEIINKSREYTKIVVYRLKKERLIFEIEKNKYTTQRNPFIIVSNIIWPSYISCWSALRYYNLTEQLPETFFVITPKIRKKRKIEFGNIRIVFVKLSPKYFFGYKKEVYQGFEIFIAEREKALIDSALLKKISFSEICDIIKSNKKKINFDLLIKYLVKIKNKALVKRFGFLFNKIGINTDKLKKFIDFKYVPLEYSIKIGGKKNKEWRVIENVNL